MPKPGATWVFNGEKHVVMKTAPCKVQCISINGIGFFHPETVIGTEVRQALWEVGITQGLW